MTQVKTPIYALKNITKLDIEGHIYYRVAHVVRNTMTALSIFELGQDPKDKNGLAMTEIYVQEIPEDLRGKLISNDNVIPLTQDDRELMTSTLETKMDYVRALSDKQINVGFQRKLLQFVEVGGHYFGYVFEAGMPYTKLYYLAPDTTKPGSLFVGGVTPEQLPYLLEALSGRILKNVNELTIQVNERVYARISRVKGKEKVAVVTVVVAGEAAGKEAELRLVMAFSLRQEANGDWHFSFEDTSLGKVVQKEAQTGFESIYTDLLVKVFERRGLTALEPYTDKKEEELMV